MAIRSLSLAGLDAAAAREAIARAVDATPPDAVVRLRVDGPLPAALAPLLGARALRAIAGGRDVSVGRAAFGPPGAAPPPVRGPRW
jgi:hypothetical protein